MDYVVVSGASRKNEKWEHSDGETVSVEGKSEAEKLATDPMYRLEHNVGDKRKAEDNAPRIAKILVSHACILQGTGSVLFWSIVQEKSDSWRCH